MSVDGPLSVRFGSIDTLESGLEFDSDCRQVSRQSDIEGRKLRYLNDLLRIEDATRCLEGAVGNRAGGRNPIGKAERGTLALVESRGRFPIGKLRLLLFGDAKPACQEAMPAPLLI
jgi:hypothetical protein